MEMSLKQFRNDVEHSSNLLWKALILGLLAGPIEGIIIYFLMGIFGILGSPAIYG